MPEDAIHKLKIIIIEFKNGRLIFDLNESVRLE